MKKILFLTALLAIFATNGSLYGQTNKKNTIGAHFAFGDGDYGYPRNVLGNINYDTKYYYNIGVDYSRKLSKRWDFCSGIEYTYIDMMSRYMLDPNSQSIKEYSKFVTIPFDFKYNFWKFVYIGGGLSAIIIDSEYVGKSVGMLLGSNCGIGLDFKYEFDSSVVLSLNPYFRLNESFGRESHHTGFIFPQWGVRLGMGYKF